MATFYGGEQLVGVLTPEYNQNTTGAVNEDIYTVPAGHYAHIDWLFIEKWDTLVISVKENAGGATYSTTLPLPGILSTQQKNENVKMPATADKYYDSGAIINVTGDGFFQNPTIARCIVYLYKKP